MMNADLTEETGGAAEFPRAEVMLVLDRIPDVTARTIRWGERIDTPGFGRVRALARAGRMGHLTILLVRNFDHTRHNFLLLTIGG